MASSGTITGSKTPGKVPTVEWEITSQNAGANTSTLKWWVKYSSAAGYSTFGTFSGTITIDGQAKAVSGTVSASGSGTIDSGTVTISHNADGTKSAAIKLVGGIAGTSGWPSSYKGLSGTASLDRIARPPAKPAAPSVSAQTASSFKAALGSAPSTNGSAITGYEWQRATNSGFTAGTASVSTGASTRNCTFSGLAANSDYWVRVRAKSAAGSSAWSAGTAVSTTPAAPAAPTSAAVVRVSDGSQTVSWVRNPTTIAPYTSQFVERRDDVNTAWVRVGSLNGTATSFTDTSTVANRRYDYRVQAENAGGKSAYSGTVSINTTPAAPTGVAAVKQGTSIVVSWVREAVQAGVTTHEVWDKPAGGAAVLVGTVGAVDTWTHSTPDAAKTHQYYVIAKAGALASAASVPSNVVQLAAPPLAPTRVAPVGVIDRGKTVVLQWKHNPVDTTVQSAFELQYRINGGAWVPVSGSTAQSYSLAAPGVSGTLEWQG
ncbi:fibronectin type III domain-containing protein, partial [Timonella senegalensis]|uniref:fibronectin type III domain-containing protein n=1 Tax=Timonella senegalensis TaxID=1465825 RepID=UPI0028B17F46